MTTSTFGIVKSINSNDFINEFKAYDRMDNFSYQGLNILFDSLEQTALECEMNIELDVIALCCEYNEDVIDDIISNYDIDLSDESFKDKKELVENYLHENTFVCGQYEDDNCITHFIYQAF